jgi:hypothetical protein
MNMMCVRVLSVEEKINSPHANQRKPSPSLSACSLLTRMPRGCSSLVSRSQADCVCNGERGCPPPYEMSTAHLQSCTRLPRFHQTLMSSLRELFLICACPTVSPFATNLLRRESALTNYCGTIASSTLRLTCFFETPPLPA